MAKGEEPARNGRETFRQARHFMMERTCMGVLKCAVTENFFEVVVFAGKSAGKRVNALIEKISLKEQAKDISRAAPNLKPAEPTA